MVVCLREPKVVATEEICATRRESVAQISRLADRPLETGRKTIRTFSRWRKFIAAATTDKATLATTPVNVECSRINSAAKRIFLK